MKARISKHDILAAFVLLFFCLLVHWGDSIKTKKVKEEMLVTLPPFFQVMLSGGDRYLAANANAMRALVTDPSKLNPEEMSVLARVHKDAAWFNPYHEDNYYTAAAILPWNGQLEADEYVLYRAAMARSYDPWPAFQYGFLQFYFRKNPVLGGDWLRYAATRTLDENEKLQFEAMATNWYAKSPSSNVAIALLESMEKSTHYSGFKNYLHRRIIGLRNLKALNDAAIDFHDKYAKWPASLDDLLKFKFIQSIPVDPFGQVYKIDENGKVIAVVAIVNRGEK